MFTSLKVSSGFYFGLLLSRFSNLKVIYRLTAAYLHMQDTERIFFVFGMEKVC